MTVALALLALILPSLILIAWQLERRERAQERAETLAAYERDRTSWADERRELLNRIKPETAQYVAPSHVTPNIPIHLDDDESYWASIPKDELAERVDAAERQMALATTVPGEAGSE